MSHMLRLLLALLFAFLPLTASANAACTNESPIADSCCCSPSADLDCVGLRSLCCDIADSAPAMPARSNNEIVPAPVIVSIPTIHLAPPTLVVAPDPATGSKPLHCATNKIYLLKRSLLI